LNRAGGWAALAGFLLALAVHIATVFGVDVSSRFPSVWLLHIGALLVFGLFVFSARGAFANGMKLHVIMDHLPTSAVLAVAVAFAYALFNFFLGTNVIGAGNAEVVAGQYVLTSHGRVLAHVSELEYHLRRAWELRLFSGHWLFFYLVPMVYFFFWREQPARQV
jgi:hypothetical protein